ncbi:hypothetical protein N656DRAFT_591011 [Canariomyces notabilis]|uniref:Uncharacterized protein n=1 Tax=Canariomyces notabilis TaxID=2074819 RepID=A0AAN6TIC5_9PEZI|nr:hypothetical protein N656DRAFT_591011 [Canariomyces arenarius]
MSDEPSLDILRKQMEDAIPACALGLMEPLSSELRGEVQLNELLFSRFLHSLFLSSSGFLSKQSSSGQSRYWRLMSRGFPPQLCGCRSKPAPPLALDELRGTPGSTAAGCGASELWKQVATTLQRYASTSQFSSSKPGTHQMRGININTRTHISTPSMSSGTQFCTIFC